MLTPKPTCKNCGACDYKAIPNGYECEYCGTVYEKEKESFEYVPSVPVCGSTFAGKKMINTQEAVYNALDSVCNKYDTELGVVVTGRVLAFPFTTWIESIEFKDGKVEIKLAECGTD